MTGTTSGREDAGREQVQGVLLVADDDGVAGVVAALVADDVVDAAAEQVGGLALALVAPLGADEHDRGHRGPPCRRRSGRPVLVGRRPDVEQPPALVVGKRAGALAAQRVPDAAARRSDPGAPRGRAVRASALLAQEVAAADRLLGLADRAGRLGQRGEAAQEAAVRLVRPGHRAVALPAVAAQQVEAAVVAGRGRRRTPRRRGPAERLLGEQRPRERVGGVRGGDLDRRLAGVERGERGLVLRQQRGRRSGHQVLVRLRHPPILPHPPGSLLHLVAGSIVHR